MVRGAIKPTGAQLSEAIAGELKAVSTFLEVFDAFAFSSRGGKKEGRFFQDVSSHYPIFEFASALDSSKQLRQPKISNHPY